MPLLIYQSFSYVDGTNGPIYPDYYGRVFNNNTGEMLSDEVQLTNNPGHEHIGDIQVNLDGSFQIFYKAEDKSILAKFDSFTIRIL